MGRKRPFSNSLTKRLKVTVAYDGTDFRGWAAQPELRTVQGTLTEAVRRISGEEVEIVGASRTDSGAHAKGQVFHVDSPIPAERFAEAMNRSMDEDVRILRAINAPAEFNSRFWADRRHYRYRILEGQDDPFRGRYAYMQHHLLDESRMKEAATLLVGRHDYRAFTEELDPHIQNTVREMFSVEVSRHRDEIWIDIVGTAFLRGMMRRMSGVLWEIGRHRRPVDDVSRLLSPDQRTDLDWPVVLPARGLTLMRIWYGRTDHRDKASEQE